jgi:hypothetical protein
MNQQVVDQTSDRRQHSPRCRINQVENILRSGPLRQDSFNESVLLSGPAITCSGSSAMPMPCTAACSLARANRSIPASVLTRSWAACSSRLVNSHRAPPSKMSSVLATVWNFGKSSRVFRPAIPFEKGAADDHHTLRFAEGLRHQPGDVFDHRLCADGNIKSLFDHIDAPVRRLDEEIKSAPTNPSPLKTRRSSSSIIRSAS